MAGRYDFYRGENLITVIVKKLERALCSLISKKQKPYFDYHFQSMAFFNYLSIPQLNADSISALSFTTVL